tara:strand:- start:136 stop:411 length:276 start_codon:yes stop_codon:yes gene_type:complete
MKVMYRVKDRISSEKSEQIKVCKKCGSSSIIEIRHWHANQMVDFDKKETIMTQGYAMCEGCRHYDDMEYLTLEKDVSEYIKPTKQVQEKRS